MSYLLDILLCGFATFTIAFSVILAFFTFDFILYKITGNCILHTIYRLVERNIK